jgi:hypothetical protein
MTKYEAQLASRNFQESNTHPSHEQLSEHFMQLIVPVLQPTTFLAKE